MMELQDSEIRPGNKCYVALDITMNGLLVFKKGEEVIVESINAKPESPAFKYIVYSKRMDQRYALQRSNLDSTPYKPSSITTNTSLKSWKASMLTELKSMPFALVNLILLFAVFALLAGVVTVATGVARQSAANHKTWLWENQGAADPEELDQAYPREPVPGQSVYLRNPEGYRSAQDEYNHADNVIGTGFLVFIVGVVLMGSYGTTVLLRYNSLKSKGVLPDKRKESATRAAAYYQSAYKQCPYCSETILQTAIKCRYCASDLVKTCQHCIRSETNPYAKYCGGCGTEFTR